MGQPAPRELLVDVVALERAYFSHRPDPENPAERVAFGTSGHRGSALQGSFSEAHVLAIVQSICEFRRAQRIDGPRFLARDTHALSGLALDTALEVLAANGVETVIQKEDQVLPTPVVSHAILAYNRGRMQLADGILVTPSDDPAQDGGIKYSPPHGGPAGPQVTRGIQQRANELLARGNAGVKRIPAGAAWRARTTRREEILHAYVKDLRSVVDVDAIREARVALGADPLGGAAARCWSAIAAQHALEIEILDPSLDPGLMNPNHYLPVAIEYLLTHRPAWPARAVIGRTLVSSSMIDRVVREAGRQLYEVAVGFKSFVPLLLDGSCCFAGEESGGASLVRQDGTVWTTEGDGLVMGLLAAEISARTGRDPGDLYRLLELRMGPVWHTRIDAPATPEAKAQLARLSAASVEAATLAGERIHAKLTKAAGDGAPIDGLKVTAPSGWFAARPSGTDPVYALYAESFRGPEHLDRLVRDAQEIVSTALAGRR